MEGSHEREGRGRRESEDKTEGEKEGKRITHGPRCLSVFMTPISISINHIHQLSKHIHSVHYRHIHNVHYHLNNPNDHTSPQTTPLGHPSRISKYSIF